MRCEIRRAVPDGAKVLAEIGWKYFDETFAPYNNPENMTAFLQSTFNEEIQGKEIADPLRRIFIAWLGETPMGYAHLYMGPPEPSIKGMRPVEILRFYVDATGHGRGIAHDLMKVCLEEAKSLGFETLWLGVWEKNLKAQKIGRAHV